MSLTPDQLRAYLRERMGLDVARIDDETPLFSSSLLDSFSMVDLIMFIEERGALRISPGEVTLDHLDSIGRIVRFVERRKQS